MGSRSVARGTNCDGALPPSSLSIPEVCLRPCGGQANPGFFHQNSEGDMALGFCGGRNRCPSVVCPSPRDRRFLVSSKEHWSPLSLPSLSAAHRQRAVCPVRHSLPLLAMTGPAAGSRREASHVARKSRPCRRLARCGTACQRGRGGAPARTRTWNLRFRRPRRMWRKSCLERNLWDGRPALQRICSAGRREAARAAVSIWGVRA